MQTEMPGTFRAIRLVMRSHNEKDVAESNSTQQKLLHPSRASSFSHKKFWDELTVPMSLQMFQSV